jgi:putative phage-type endonuclease
MSSNSRPFELVPFTDREDWLEKRRSGVGGSDVAALLGHSKTRGAYAVYASKVAPVDVQPHANDEAAHWGNVLEPVVAAEFAQRTGYAVHEGKFLARSTRWPWLLATVDRWVHTGGLPKPEWEAEEAAGRRGYMTTANVRRHNESLVLDADAILEVKTQSAFKAHEWSGGQVPDWVPRPMPSVSGSRLVGPSRSHWTTTWRPRPGCGRTGCSSSSRSVRGRTSKQLRIGSSRGWARPRSPPSPGCPP